MTKYNYNYVAVKEHDSYKYYDQINNNQTLL